VCTCSAAPFRKCMQRLHQMVYAALLNLVSHTVSQGIASATFYVATSDPFHVCVYSWHSGARSVYVHWYLRPSQSGHCKCNVLHNDLSHICVYFWHTGARSVYVHWYLSPSQSGHCKCNVLHNDLSHICVYFWHTGARSVYVHWYLSPSQSGHCK